MSPSATMNAYVYGAHVSEVADHEFLISKHM